MDEGSGCMDNPLRQNLFRAGNAHAGVIVILSLVCQMLADAAILPSPLVWFVRIGVPLSAILIAAGFFFSMPTAPQPGQAVSLIYVGAVILAVSVLTLAIGLIRTPAEIAEAQIMGETQGRRYGPRGSVVDILLGIVASRVTENGAAARRNAAVPLDQLGVCRLHLSAMIVNMSLGRFRRVMDRMFVVAAS
jgi:hypothetical protein